MSDRSASNIVVPRQTSQSPRADRRRSWGERTLQGRSGAVSGTAWRGRLANADLNALTQAWMVVAAIAGLAAIVNALTVQADMPHLSRWKPWVLEGTSTLMLALLAWLPGLAVLLAPPMRSLKDAPGWSRLVALHMACAGLFSVLHVAGMVSLRQGLYAVAGAAYGYKPFSARFVYELRKDVLTYVMFAVVVWLMRRGLQRPEPARAASFDIRDGARLIRTRPGDILAATSAGNYVEFVLADGRRPLMRTTLAAMEAELGPSGFLRTHRCWLINADRVTGLRPEGAGDWTIDLDTLSAPLSRRYRGALLRLKQGESPV